MLRWKLTGIYGYNERVERSLKSFIKYFFSEQGTIQNFKTYKRQVRLPHKEYRDSTRNSILASKNTFTVLFVSLPVTGSQSVLFEKSLRFQESFALKGIERITPTYAGNDLIIMLTGQTYIENIASTVQTPIDSFVQRMDLSKIGTKTMTRLATGLAILSSYRILFKGCQYKFLYPEILYLSKKGGEYL
jgi:hypothetical protein